MNQAILLQNTNYYKSITYISKQSNNFKIMSELCANYGLI